MPVCPSSPQGQYFKAIRDGNKEEVESLLKSGRVSVDIRSAKGHTPLMVAAAAGHVDVAQVLLAHGASTTETDPVSCLDFRVETGTIETLVV